MTDKEKKKYFDTYGHLIGFNGMVMNYPYKSEYPLPMGMGDLSTGQCYRAISTLVGLFSDLSGLQQGGEDLRNYDAHAEMFLHSLKHMLLGDKKLRNKIK